MGSFYSTCSISDLCITDGDPMYMQLIIPSWVTNPYSIDGEEVDCGEKGLRVSNEAALGEFVPFGFPIEGLYADYGNIDNIVRNRNIEMLEEFFGISIEDIISCATDDRWYKHSYLPCVIEEKEEEYKGQFKSWTVGDNKMENIEILKKLTVTYFRQEHYDFLSQKTIGTDTYWEKEKDKRLKKMKKSLTDLENARPNADGKPKAQFTKGDITNDIREKYKVIKNKTTSDEQFDNMIISMENMPYSNWWRDFEYTFYIPSISRTNMFKLLPLGPQDAEDVQNQFRFITNLGTLYKVLRPSYYGSQDDNFDAYVEFHKMSAELVNGDKLELKKDNILGDIGWIIKDSLKDVNPELSNKIKDTIKEDLSEQGYNIKF